MKKKNIVAITCLALCAVGATVWAVDYWMPMHSGEEVVRKSLFDPESARFEHVRYNSATEATCGLVNAKNRMGGYVGATHFIVTADRTTHFRNRTNAEDISNAQEKIKVLQEQIDHDKLALANCKFDDK